MSKLIFNFMKSLFRFLFFTMLFMMTGIIWVHGKQIKGLKKQETVYLPVDAFAQIETDIFLNSDGELNSLSAVGSGIVFYVDDYNSYILTANHVCIPPLYDQIIANYEEKNVLLENGIVDFLGRSRKANVVFNDAEKDLCILKVSEVWTEPVILSVEPPIIGERAYIIAAPGGFAYPGAVPIFEGLYSGQAISYFQHDDVYTIPTQSGTSGAAVLNEEFEIIGVIHSAIMGNSNIGIASTHEEVSEFLYSWEILFGFRVE